MACSSLELQGDDGSLPDGKELNCMGIGVAKMGVAG